MCAAPHALHPSGGSAKRCGAIARRMFAAPASNRVARIAYHPWVSRGSPPRRQRGKRAHVWVITATANAQRSATWRRPLDRPVICGLSVRAAHVEHIRRACNFPLRRRRSLAAVNVRGTQVPRRRLGQGQVEHTAIVGRQRE